MAKPLERYCAFCGRAFDDAAAPWPRHCNCGVITYRNPLPVVNVIVPVKDGDRTGVLLIRRGIDPCRGQWAFPGGFMNIDETAEAAARRELEEETGLRVDLLTQVGAFSAVDRDPRERVVTVAYFATLPFPMPVKGADDAAEARWFSLRSLPLLAFDHADILKKACQMAGW